MGLDLVPTLDSAASIVNALIDEFALSIRSILVLVELPRGTESCRNNEDCDHK